MKLNAYAIYRMMVSFIIFFLSFLVVRFFAKPANWIIATASDFLAALQLAVLSSLSSYVFFLTLTLCIPYALFDSLMMRNLNLRMRFSFFHYFRQWKSFWDSAKELGLYRFMAFFLLWVCLAIFLFIRLDFSETQLAWMMTLLGGVLFYPLSASQKTQNLNFLVLEEIECIKLIFQKKKEQTGSWSSENEISITPSMTYPLFRCTKQFIGEKNFSIEVSKKEKPHVIFLVLESFRSKSVHVCNPEAPFELTPCFNELTKEGILWRNFYCASARSSKAVISSLFGVCAEKDSVVFNENPSFPLRGLPEILKENGYTNILLQGGDLEFDSIGEFAKAHQFELFEGMQEIAARFQKEFKGNVWGLHDEYLMSRAIEVLEEKQREGKTVFLNLTTISNHHPWRLPPGENERAFYPTEDAYERRFQTTLHYSDRILGNFVAALKKKQLFDKTLLFIFGDHGQPFGEHDSSMHDRVGLYDENTQVPLLLLAKHLNPKVIEEVASQMDLLPTVMDILGISNFHHAMGRSLARASSDGLALLHSPFPPLRIGARKEQWKWIFTPGNSEEELYDLQKDPKEKQNLADINPPILSSIRKAAKERHALLDTLFQKKKFFPVAHEEEDRVVDLNGQTQMTDQQFEEIVRNLQPTSLIINGCERLTDEAFYRIAPFCKKLKSLSMCNCWKISNLGVKALCKEAKELQHLNISDCFRIDGDLFDKDTSLHRLYLERMIFLNKQNIVDLTKKTPYLRRLSLVETPDIDDATIATVVANCPELKLLKLDARHLTDEALITIGKKARHLVAIYLSNGLHLTDKGLGALAECVNLCSAILIDLPHVTGEFLKDWKRVFLYDFYIKGAPLLRDEAVQDLLAHPLKQLQLNDCPMIKDSGIASLKELGAKKIHVVGCENVSKEAIDLLRAQGENVVYWG